METDDLQPQTPPPQVPQTPPNSIITNAGSEKKRKNSQGMKSTIDGGLFNLSGFLSVKIPPKEQNQYFIEKFTDPTLDISVRDDYFILLPNHNDPVSHFSLDIGGSLLKMVYYEPVGASFETRENFPKTPIKIKMPNFNDGQLENMGGRICFAKFMTSEIEEALGFIKKIMNQNSYPKKTTIHLTGGGAFKFYEKIKKITGLTPKKVDEMESLIGGLNFLFRNIPNEAFYFGIKDQKKHYISFNIERKLIPDDANSPSADEDGKAKETLQRENEDPQFSELQKNLGKRLTKNMLNPHIPKKKSPTSKKAKKSNRSNPKCASDSVDGNSSSLASLIDTESQSPTPAENYETFTYGTQYPYLLVNIGSGVSIVLVTGDSTFERVSGSSIGGGTFWGLVSSLTKYSSFTEMLNATLEGDNTSVDLLVGDIYGRDYAKTELGSEVIASSFGKVGAKKSSMTKEQMKKSMSTTRIYNEDGSLAINDSFLQDHQRTDSSGDVEHERTDSITSEPGEISESTALAQSASIASAFGATDADIAKSVLYMICNNIAQISYLTAIRYNVKHIYFGGYFIRDHPITMLTLTMSVQFWSRGAARAHFLKHEGYLGAIGCFFKVFQDEEEESSSNSENSENSENSFPNSAPNSESNTSSPDLEKDEEEIEMEKKFLGIGEETINKLLVSSQENEEEQEKVMIIPEN